MTYRIFGSAGLNALQAMMYDLLAKSSLASLHGGYLPWSNASLRPAAIQMLLNDIVVNKRRLAVEFGSGLSTLFLAIMMAREGGKVISFDHDSAWQQLVESWLPSDARQVATFVTAPLEPRRQGPPGPDWYRASAVISALPQAGAVDLVLVDGPPAFEKTREFARAPAIPTIRPFLAPSATIVLDDIMRIGEKAIAEGWSKLLGTPCQNLMVETGTGLWQLGRCNNIAF